MAEDIGFLLFHQILGMTEYPGSPFTGNIINDLIMFLLVPSVFIIMIIYMMVGRFFAAQANPKMRMLIGITAYLFIIAGGYYSSFARIAGPYFFLLILVMGLFYFILGHFGIGRAGGSMPGSAISGTLEGSSLAEDLARKKVRLHELKAGLQQAQRAGDQRGIVDYQRQISELQAETRILESDIKRMPGEWAMYQRLKAKYGIRE